LNSAKKQNIPVAALCGAVDISVADQEKLGLSYAVSIMRGVSDLEQALRSGRSNLVHSAYNLAKVLKLNS
jgi:glycerate kinase